MGHFSSAGPGAPVALGGQMRMGIFGADYQMGRLLAGVAVAHGRGQPVGATGSTGPTGRTRR